MRRAYWSRERLLEYRNKRLREIVKYAYNNVPFYHEKFMQAGLNPEDIRTADDLSKLPVIRKDEVKRNLERMVSKEYNVSGLKMLRTSGSTGEPLYFYISRREDEFRKARHLRANIACGQRLRDRWVTITSPIYFNQATRLQRFLRFYAPMSVSVFDDVSTQISVIGRLKPDVLDGYASSLLLLAREVEKRGIDTIRPRIIISGADLIDPASRQIVEKVFGVPFYDQYGAAEFERLAWQCEEKNQYHVDADSVVMQFVDENGEEVAAGETGEIVCTSLFNKAMPFIRYAVGDIGKASEENSCACGRTLPLMKIVEGRKDAIALLPDGRAISSFAFIAGTYKLSFYNEIEKFRVIQKKPNNFKFLMVMKNDRIKEESAKEEVESYFRKMLNLENVDVNFEVEFVNDLPLDGSGKFKIFVSELEKS
jgi:phenylacetate-CoA ligase